MSVNFLNEANEVTFTLWQSAVSREKRGKKLFTRCFPKFFKGNPEYFCVFDPYSSGHDVNCRWMTVRFKL